MTDESAGRCFIQHTPIPARPAAMPTRVPIKWGSMRATTCAFILSVLLPCPLAAQATLAGIWEGDILRPKLQPQHIMMELTVDGPKLTGIIHTPSAELEIEDGTVKGRAVEFTTSRPISGARVPFYWTGTINPARDQIAFSYVDQDRRPSTAVKFTVKRTK